MATICTASVTVHPAAARAVSEALFMLMPSVGRPPGSYGMRVQLY